MDKDSLLQVGVITSAHGIKGEVKVYPTTDDSGRFKKLKSAFIEKKDGIHEINISSVKFFKQFVILGLDIAADRDAAESLRQCPIYVDREHAVKLNKDEYFIADLIGLDVYDSDEAKIGIITDVIETGANDVYQIEFDGEYLYKGKFPKEKEVLLPAIKECILDVDIKNGRMKVEIMEGLIEN